MQQQFLVEYQQRGSNEERDRHRAAHIAFRQGLGEKLVLAGPLLDAAGVPTGSLIILEAQDEAAARRWAAGDPFVKAAVLELLSVRPMRIAFMKSSVTSPSPK